MIDWIKNHVEAIVCFSLFGLLLLTGWYFLSTEEQRVEIGEMAEVRIDEGRRDEIIEKVMRGIELRGRKAETVFADRPLVHYDLLLRRNPFYPAVEVVLPGEEPEEPDAPDVPDVPDIPDEPDVPPEPRMRLVVRGIVEFGGVFTATIENVDTGRAYFRRINDTVEGYKIKHIDRDKVVLSKDEKTVELKYGR